MIKDGMYFADFIRTFSQCVETATALKLMKAQSNRGLSCKQLFQKELTPSDVGKLNGLLVPKKYAVKFFPSVPERLEEYVAVEKVDDVRLAFYDKSMKLWEFRYCYWRSSQSYVLTRGRNRFVKEKQLKANDTIAFCLCECRENADATRTFYMIDVNGENSSSLVKVASPSSPTELELQLNLEPSVAHDSIEKSIEEEGMLPMNNVEKQGFKLFGVQIL